MNECVDSSELYFRKLLASDLKLMHKWLNQDFVCQWYGWGDYAYQDIVLKYNPRIDGQVPTVPYLILLSDLPIGYIQTYRLSDHPEYNKYVGGEEHSAGLDLFIGERAYLHKGYGSLVLIKFLEQVVFSDDRLNSCIVGPEPANFAAIKCYEKVGFRYYKSVHIPSEPQPEYLMRIDRETFKVVKK